METGGQFICKLKMILIKFYTIVGISEAAAGFSLICHVSWTGPHKSSFRPSVFVLFSTTNGWSNIIMTSTWRENGSLTNHQWSNWLKIILTRITEVLGLSFKEPLSNYASLSSRFSLAMMYGNKLYSGLASLTRRISKIDGEIPIHGGNFLVNLLL